LDNNYLPYNAKIIDIKIENSNIKSYFLSLPEELKNKKITPGQFFEVSIFSQGEAPISISEIDSEKNNILLCIAKVGVITESIHNLKTGDYLGIRGPYGNGFPIEDLKGNNIVLIGGGIGLAPLRAPLMHFAKNAENYGKIELLYGAKTSGDLIYKNELEKWKEIKNMNVKVSIDKSESNWNGNVGFVTSFLNSSFKDPSKILFSLDKDFKKTKILICGPTPMVNATIKALDAIKFPDKDVFITLENRMKCGIGKCGHCNIGHKYVCTNGPVFSLTEMKALPKEY
jgi:sulfhydrogenase subunit gamma (sulfur reductase)